MGRDIDFRVVQSRSQTREEVTPTGFSEVELVLQHHHTRPCTLHVEMRSCATGEVELNANEPKALSNFPLAFSIWRVAGLLYELFGRYTSRPYLSLSRSYTVLTALPDFYL